MSSPRDVVIPPWMHAAQCVAGLAIAVAGLSVIAFVGHGWSWLLFSWGVLLGPVIVGWLFVQGDVTARGLARAGGQTVDLRALRHRRMRRFWSLYVALCCVGFTMGAVAARLDSIWPDAFLTGYAVVASLPLLVAYPALKRKVAAAHIE